MERGDAGSFVDINQGAWSRLQPVLFSRCNKMLPQTVCEKSQVCCENERVEANCENPTQCMRVGSTARGIV